MIREIVRVIYTNAFGGDVKDSHVAQVLETHPNGQLRILFDDGVDYWAFPEEVKEIS